MRAKNDAPVRLRVRLLAIVVVVGLPLAVDWFAGYVTYHLGDYRENHRGNFRMNADTSGFRRFDPDYHHGFTAKREATEKWGEASYNLKTNSLGFKDRTT